MNSGNLLYKCPFLFKLANTEPLVCASPGAKSALHPHSTQWSRCSYSPFYKRRNWGSGSLSCLMWHSSWGTVVGFELSTVWEFIAMTWCCPIRNNNRRHTGVGPPFPLYWWIRGQSHFIKHRNVHNYHASTFYQSYQLYKARISKGERALVFLQ